MSDNADTPVTEPVAPADPVDAFAAVLGKGFDDPVPPPKEGEEPEPEAKAEEKADDAPKTVKVQVDGKDVELTQEQIAEAYKSGLRQQDYTRKTMETAETRKAAEAEVQKTQQERSAYAQNLQRLQVQTEAALQQSQQIDWQALLDSDPVEYLKQQHLVQTRQASLQQVYAEQNRIAQQFQAEQAQQLKNHLTAQHQALLDKLPDWKDEKKASADKEALKAYLLKEGYDEASVSGISDARAVVLARKAMLYDQITAKAQETAKAIQKLPPRMERPGVARPTDGRTADMQALKRSGKTDDAANLFAKML